MAVSYSNSLFIVKSMHPVLILKEDLNGCELQVIDKELYKKTYPGIILFHLQPFRVSHLLPGERNLILFGEDEIFTHAEMTSNPSGG